LDKTLDLTTIERVSLDMVHPDAANARVHGEQNLATIKASLSEHGQYRPLIVQRATGRIIAGNGTYQAAKALGWTEINVMYLDVDDLQAQRIAIVDNRSAELAEWDHEILASLLAQAGDLGSLGFSQEQFDELLASVSEPMVAEPSGDDPGAEVPENLQALQAKWNTQRGQLWIIKSKSLAGKAHRLLIGDSANAEDVKRVMDGVSFLSFAIEQVF
jgi:ParB-like chromosome segregation protein Spo0J